MGRTFIIAEAGVNHNGDVNIAKKLINAAVEVNADAIKFQTFTADKVVSKSALKADYQRIGTDNVETQYDMIKKLELNLDAHKLLKCYCDKRKIIFMSSPFDIESIDLLNDLGVEIFKIPSGEITNLPYLRMMGSLRKKIILSTGMSVLKEVGDALDVLADAGTLKEDITILHCNTEYPTPYEDVNLNAMLTLKKEFNVDVGYSDHTLGIEVSVAAVALGANVIEKHFTLNKNMEGPDHSSSLEPDEFKVMAMAIRNIEKALGGADKRVTVSEMRNISVARKSIVASRRIKIGEVLSEHNITTKRPGTGITPMMWDDVIGRHAARDFEKDDLIVI